MSGFRFAWFVAGLLTVTHHGGLRRKAVVGGNCRKNLNKGREKSTNLKSAARPEWNGAINFWGSLSFRGFDGVGYLEIFVFDGSLTSVVNVCVSSSSSSSTKTPRDIAAA